MTPEELQKKLEKEIGIEFILLYCINNEKKGYYVFETKKTNDGYPFFTNEIKEVILKKYNKNLFNMKQVLIEDNRKIFIYKEQIHLM